MNRTENIPDAPLERLTYTKAELCKALRLSPTTLWRLEKKGLLEPIPGLRHKIFSRNAVERFIDGKATP